jgi:hypothetical protein
MYNMPSSQGEEHFLKGEKWFLGMEEGKIS